MNELYIEKLLEIMAHDHSDVVKIADVYRLVQEIEEFRGLHAIDLSDANECGDGACKL